MLASVLAKRRLRSPVGLASEYLLDAGAAASTQVITDSIGGRDGQRGSTSGATSNDPTWVAEGLSFDGGDFATLGDASTCICAHDTDSWTFLVVVKRNATGANHQLFQARKITANNMGVDFYIKSDNTLVFRVSGNDGTQENKTTTGTVADTNWHVIAASYNGVTKKARLIREGAGGFRENTQAFVKTWTIPSGNFDLGAFGSWASTNYLNGRIAYVAMWSRALGDAEITQAWRALQRVAAVKGITLQ